MNNLLKKDTRYGIISKEKIFIKKRKYKCKRCSVTREMSVSMPILLENGLVLVIVYGAERYKRKVVEKLGKMEKT